MAGRHPLHSASFAFRSILLGGFLLLAVALAVAPGLAQEPATDRKPDLEQKGDEKKAEINDLIEVFSKQAIDRDGGFQFPAIDPKTPLADLLPVAPKAVRPARLLVDDLSQMPEIQFQESFQQKELPEAMKKIAHQFMKIRHLNEKKNDAFLEALIGQRTDLQGMPFAMGDACRTKADRSAYFSAAVNVVRQAFAESTNEKLASGTSAEAFWISFQQKCNQQDKEFTKNDAACEPHVTSARIAALMQILGTESPGMRRGLVKYLASVSTVEATKTLAKLALFSAEDEVRLPAIEALRVRRERDYTDVLLEGFQYPLPAVAKRASDALVRLERKDVTPELVNLLDQADPREPVAHKKDNKQVSHVREVVRINHNRNCILCHSPAGQQTFQPMNVVEKSKGGQSVGVQKMHVATTAQDGPAVTAPVPVPGQQLTPPSQGYGNGRPADIFVRVDVTYLRQDFSVMQSVENAAPWPEMQRFDFLVRTRALNDQEVAEFKQLVAKRPAGFVTPYQRALLSTLRELTGRDTAPTAQARRDLLNLPAPAKREISHGAKLN